MCDGRCPVCDSYSCRCSSYKLRQYQQDHQFTNFSAHPLQRWAQDDRNERVECELRDRQRREREEEERQIAEWQRQERERREAAERQAWEQQQQADEAARTIDRSCDGNTEG